MRVRGGELMGDAIAAAEDDGQLELSAGHVADVGGVVHELVHANQREGPGHELDDGSQSAHSSADAQAGKTGFADGRVNDALGTKARQHPFGDFVGAIVFGHFFA